ncbi:HEPN domain-containing protein [Spirosoma sp. RP8]|uniref:HEPN domain-containing protein n=1 Tax=Spirosoma liriopis TaxID=2937440 RepID=A0ABT0HK73_9BACT|nr:HEPN domain-containing protein [Spirosoma liriopis]MCK8492564.1 HEPN domain-containing protein [Spirosoma liriopis]
MSTVDNYMLIAEDCLEDARLLHRYGKYRGACGRTYYAYFNAIRALLATKEITTKSHAAARGLFSAHFVKEGPFAKKDSTSLNELFELRQTGEYDPDEDISESDTQKAIEIAADFLLQAEAYLRENGFPL